MRLRLASIPARNTGLPLMCLFMRLVYAMVALSGLLLFTPPGVKSSSLRNFLVGG